MFFVCSLAAAFMPVDAAGLTSRWSQSSRAALVSEPRSQGYSLHNLPFTGWEMQISESICRHANEIAHLSRKDRTRSTVFFFGWFVCCFWLCFCFLFFVFVGSQVKRLEFLKDPLIFSFSPLLLDCTEKKNYKKS